jgi:hypothetical protein
MAQQRQLLMSLNTRYYTKSAAENPRRIRISANEIKGKTQFAVADSLVLPTELTAGDGIALAAITGLRDRLALLARHFCRKRVCRRSDSHDA